MDWSQLDSVQKIAQIVAIVIGGLWVYFNSLRGRVFVPRLQVELSGKLLRSGATRYVLATLQVKNVGSSIVRIDPGPTGLKLTPLRAKAGASEPESLIREEEQTTAFSVLDKHIIRRRTTENGLEVVEVEEKKIKAIEPGVAVNEQKLIFVPHDKHDAFALELRIGGLSGRWWGGSGTLTAIAIAAREDLPARPDQLS